MKKTINYLLAGGVALSLLALASCGDDDKSLPPIDGYNNSDEVGATNLKAHWTFDDTNDEGLSSTAPSHTYGTVGFTDGQIGKALKLTGGALVYPSIANIGEANSLSNFTVSLWVNVTNNKKTASESATALFAILYANDDDIWGNISMLAETGAHLPSSDTLLLKPLLKTLVDGGGTSLQDNISVVNGDKGKDFLGAKTWSHFVARWNGTSHQFEIFGDGVNVGAYSDRGTTPQLSMRTPAQAVFGSLTYNDIGFAGAPDRGIPLANASIDDVRVFNTALTDAEIKALFNLGTAGR
ncbi:MAG: LamG-like jellyroll fold domain-containing protein [Chryseolinea sp.]